MKQSKSQYAEYLRLTDALELAERLEQIIMPRFRPEIAVFQFQEHVEFDAENRMRQLQLRLLFDERLCQRTARTKLYAIEQQSTEKLLAYFLRSTVEVCDNLFVARLAETSPHELGISNEEHARLLAGIELGRRVTEAKQKYTKPETLNSTKAAIEFCRIHFARIISDCRQEQFHIVTLNTKNHVLATHLITIGTLDASLVHPREVFRPAIRDAASSIILAHNHPSGDPSPSPEDFAVTRRLESVGKTIGIDVLDHVVMGRAGLVSVKESGNMNSAY